MSQKYFENFPNIYYSNKLVKDLTRRVRLIDSIDVTPYVMYPYEMKHQLRSDLVAEYYYNEPQLDWMIYLANEIYDPYWEWYLNDEQFEAKLIEKYGSVEQSMKKIKHYINNWATDDQELTADFYENNLALSWKKYYVPSLWKTSASKITKNGRTDSTVFNNTILTYKRKPLDVIINTNRHLDYVISANNSSVGFTDGELVDIKVVGGTTETVGTAEVVISNTSTLRVRHVAGNTSANATHMKYIVGETSGANVTVANSAVAVKTLEEKRIIRTIRLENVSEDEERFWSPVTYFDYEFELNESRKVIRLPSSGVKDLMVQKYQERLQENMDPLTRLVSNTV